MSDTASRRGVSKKKTTTKKVVAKKRPATKKATAKKVTNKAAKKVVSTKTVSVKKAKKKVVKKLNVKDTSSVSPKTPDENRRASMQKKLASVEAFHGNSRSSKDQTARTSVFPVSLSIVKRSPSAVTVHTFMTEFARVAGIFFVIVGALFSIHYTQLAIANNAPSLMTMMANTSTFGDPGGDGGTSPGTGSGDMFPDYHFDSAVFVDDFGKAFFEVFAQSIDYVQVEVFDEQQIVIFNDTLDPVGDNQFKVTTPTTDWAEGQYYVSYAVHLLDGSYQNESDSLYVNPAEYVGQYKLKVPFNSFTFNEFFTESEARGHCVEFITLNPQLVAECFWNNERFVQYDGNGADQTGVFSLPVDWGKIAAGEPLNLPDPEPDPDPDPAPDPDPTPDPTGDTAGNTATDTVSDGLDPTNETTASTTNTFVDDSINNETTDLLEDDTLVNESVDNTATEESEEVPDNLPVVEIDVDRDEIFTGYTSFRVETEHVTALDFYVRDQSGLTPKWIGRATSLGDNKWVFGFKSKNTPNGNFGLFAKAKSVFGDFTTDPVPIRIRNAEEVVLTPIQEEVVKNIEDVASEVSDELELQVTSEPTDTIPSADPVSSNSLPDELADSNIGDDTASDQDFADLGSDSAKEDEDEEDDEVTTQLKTILEINQEKVDKELQRLAVALRQGDETAAAKSKDRIEKLLGGVARSTLTADEQDLSEKLAQKVDGIVTEYTQKVEATDRIITDRSATDVLTDSDNDGISDYDEVSIFNTDPFTADSDNDGFVDGAEVLSGFDPLDETRESLITYESPKERGVIREDVFKVERIQTVKDLEPAPTTINPATEETVVATPEPERLQAVIEGKALPNSFVTIYIFSTPIVVTVKTDPDGSWRYEFDHELEDGTHDVYVGITDNAGRIVAKSEPFRFVKEAQAVETLEAATVTAGPVTSGDASGNSNMYLLYAVVALSVVAVGLVLILLGADLRRRRPDEELLAPSV